jgi:hypothetical protein
MEILFIIYIFKNIYFIIVYWQFVTIIYDEQSDVMIALFVIAQSCQDLVNRDWRYGSSMKAWVQNPEQQKKKKKGSVNSITSALICWFW